jgi:membrane protein
VLWLAAGLGYSDYLARHNYYASTYAGLANLMIALFFLFITAVIFIFGAELNRAFIGLPLDIASDAPAKRQTKSKAT